MSKKKCNKCGWYSKYTLTCDYYLINGVGHRRGCPWGDRCKKFTPESKGNFESESYSAKEINRFISYYLFGGGK